MSKLRLAAVAAMALLALAACDAATPGPMRMQPDQVQSHLDATWKELDKGAAILWSPAYSPYFPAEWPPAGNTLWVQYAYAQGTDPGLVDGVRIASAWAKVERRRGDDTANVVTLLMQLVSAGTQGVGPLRPDSAAILSKREAVMAYALQLRGAPDESTPAGADMRAFYREWLRGNGAFADTIKSAHAAFFAWIAMA